MTHFSKEFDNDAASIFDSMQLLDKFISWQETVSWVTFDKNQWGFFKAIGTVNKESQPSGRIRELSQRDTLAFGCWLEAK